MIAPLSLLKLLRTALPSSVADRWAYSYACRLLVEGATQDQLEHRAAVFVRAAIACLNEIEKR